MTYPDEWTADDWREALAAGPGRLWTLPEAPEIHGWFEPAIPVPTEALTAAATLDDLLESLCGFPAGAATAAVRAYWLTLVGPRTCDCPMNPHHRWNCQMTPMWAQTIRDLDTNPWTVIPREDHQ